MSTYAIGDIQGCYRDLLRLLEAINFDRNNDTLWCVGDLVNRGPQSLEVLRFFKKLGDKAIVTLGNHDLHLLAVGNGHTDYLKPKDTLHSVLQAPDNYELLTWLRHCPLLHHDQSLNFTMIHAGLPPQWDLATAQQCAREVETVLKSAQYPDYLANLYGNEPKKWSDKLAGWERLRFITNCFTRMRYCNDEGKLALKNKGTPRWNTKDSEQPWFLLPNRATRSEQIIFGHWSTLGYYAKHNVYALDTGCLWGGALTALRLEDQQVFSVQCTGERIPGED